MSLRWFHGGQGTVGGAGVNESLAFLVNSFATERRELEKERREERRELLDRLEKALEKASKDHQDRLEKASKDHQDRLEKASKDHQDRCENLVARNEKLKV
jgi:transcription elongation GreA/GreB family factor